MIAGWGRAALAAGTLALGTQALAGDWTYYRHDLAGVSNAGEPLGASQAQGLHVL